MKMNMGYTDRTIRMVGGILLLGLVAKGNVWGLIGLVPLLTGVIGICPLYPILGMETCSKDGKACCSKGKCSSDKEDKK